MTSSQFYPGIYYLEITTPFGDPSRSIVSGISLKPSQKEQERCGYLIYQDVVEQRQRIITLASEPASIAKIRITCLSQQGETFVFSYLDTNLWKEKVCHYVQLPQEVTERFVTTEALQEFFIKSY